MTTRGLETMGFRGSRASDLGRRCAIIALSLACAAFTYRVTVDVLRWRNTPTAHARDVLGNPNANERQRIDAAVIIYNDMAESIEAMRRAAEVPGRLGEEARRGLEHLRKDLR